MSASIRAGSLTDGIDQHPHSVLLLDEIEKAHPDLFNILLQVMDHGKLTDHNGKKVDFQQRHSHHDDECGRFGPGQGRDRLWPLASARATTRRRSQAVQPGVPQPARRHHPVRQFDADIIAKVVEKFVFQLEAQLSDRNITIELTPEANAWLAERGYDEKFGARPLGRVIQEHIKKPLAEEILFGKLKDGGIVKVVVEEKDGEKGLGFEYIKADAPIRPVKEDEDFDPEDGPGGHRRCRRRRQAPAQGQAGPAPACRLAPGRIPPRCGIEPCTESPPRLALTRATQSTSGGHGSRPGRHPEVRA